MPAQHATTHSMPNHSVKKNWLSLSLIVLASLPWSLTLGVLGVWMLDHRQDGMFESSAVATSGGVAALCGAQLVFLFCIADRVFPKANQIMTRMIEGGLGAIFLGSTLVFAVVSLNG